MADQLRKQDAAKEQEACDLDKFDGWRGASDPLVGAQRLQTCHYSMSFRRTKHDGTNTDCPALDRPSQANKSI